jgi:hypothetical protein
MREVANRIPLWRRHQPVVSDHGYDGVVLRYTNPALECARQHGERCAGAFQDLVDAASLGA